MYILQYGPSLKLHWPIFYNVRVHLLSEIQFVAVSKPFFFFGNIEGGSNMTGTDCL